MRLDLGTGNRPLPVRVVAGVGGVLLAVVGALLLPRPLSSLVALAITAAMALLLLAGWLVRTRRSWWRWPLAALAAAAAVAVTLRLPGTVRLVPYALAVLLVLGAARSAAQALRPGGVTIRLAHGCISAAGLIGAWLVWQWPDAGSVLAGVAFAAAALVTGLLLVVGALRPRRVASARPPRARGALRLVGAGLVLVLAGAGLAGSVRLQSGIARVEDFYAGHDAVPQTPGLVLRVGPYDGEVPDGAVAVRLLYVTTHSDGSPALASAVATYPAEPAGAQTRPVLAWQHGTTGVGQTCAPSLGTQALTEEAIPGISRAIERGWVVVATDYPGQGTAGRYPYLIGEGEGRATLDAIRAVGQIDEAGASTQAWIWGHSQGGHATLWAGELAEDYAPEIDVVGVAALSAAADPRVLAERVMGAGGGILSDLVTSLVLVPYSQEYADVSIADSVHPGGVGIVETFASRCVNESPTLVSALVAASLRWDWPLYRIDLTSGPTRERLIENIADGVVPAPMFLGQGDADEVIPIVIQRELAASLCDAGRVVAAHEYAGRSHMGVIEPGSPLLTDLEAWVQAVETGGEPSTCE